MLEGRDWWAGDCLDLMKDIPDGAVDMVLCDLPYGTTQNKWDTVIPFAPLWEQYRRICKLNAAIVLTSAQPFTSVLVTSQLDIFKYQWVWQKEAGTGLLNAKKQPLRDHEDVNVFYRKQPVYNPQFTQGRPYTIVKGGDTTNYNPSGKVVTNSDGRRYPKTVQRFNRDKSKIHPTQKPVALFEYLIRTYTNEGDLVLDNCAGSGTTAVACDNTKRRWLCIEQDENMGDLANARVDTNWECVKNA